MADLIDIPVPIVSEMKLKDFNDNSATYRIAAGGATCIWFDCEPGTRYTIEFEPDGSRDKFWMMSSDQRGKGGWTVPYAPSTQRNRPQGAGKTYAACPDAQTATQFPVAQGGQAWTHIWREGLGSGSVKFHVKPAPL